MSSNVRAGSSPASSTEKPPFRGLFLLNLSINKFNKLINFSLYSFASSFNNILGCEALFLVSRKRGDPGLATFFVNEIWLSFQLSHLPPPQEKFCDLF